MRISDWSSDVCSSDLDLLGVPSRVNGATRPVTARRAAINSRASAGRRNDPTARAAGDVTMHCRWYSLGPLAGGGRVSEAANRAVVESGDIEREIGRATRREGVGTYV